MRTWGVSTKPDQREAASAASHPCTMIYVTVSENFMTAKAADKVSKVRRFLRSLTCSMEQRGSWCFTGDDVSRLSEPRSSIIVPSFQLNVLNTARFHNHA